METLASEHFISYDKLHDLFAAQGNTTPRQYIKKIQLQQIAEMLIHTDETLNNIADLFGFSDQSALTKSFKSAYHISPGAYRRQHRQ